MVSRNGTLVLSSKFVDINTVAYVYLLPTICLFGLVGNVANIITLLSRRLKAVSYVYLLALAIADFLCMTFVLIFAMDWGLNNVARIREMHIHYMIVWYRTHLMLQLINMAIGSGILVVVCLTVERYMSICWPLVFRSWNNKWRAYVAVALAYVIAFILYIPMCWQFYVTALDIPTLNNSDSSNFTYDYTIWKKTDNPYGFFGSKENDATYKLVREIIVKIIPIIIIGLLNIQIIVAFRKQKKHRNLMKNRSNNMDGNWRERDDTSLLYLLMAIVLLFFVCNVPAAVNLVLIDESIQKKLAYKTFRAIANTFEITNHAVNFYVFCLCSSDYRAAFIEKFPMLKHCYSQTRRLFSVCMTDTRTPNREEYNSIMEYTDTTNKRQTEKQSTVIENTSAIIQDNELKEMVLKFNPNNRSESDFNYHSNLMNSDYGYCNSLENIDIGLTETNLNSPFANNTVEKEELCKIKLCVDDAEACMTIEKEEFV